MIGAKHEGGDVVIYNKSVDNSYRYAAVTPHEAEQLIKELRKAVDEARAAGRPKRKLGDY